MESVTDERLKVWQALSEFFLDTEVGDMTFDWVALRISECSYTLEQVQGILWHEVYPALNGNLKSMVGEWAGWTDEFLMAHIVVRQYQTPVPHRGRVGDEIARCWEEVAARLTPPIPVE